LVELPVWAKAGAARSDAAKASGTMRFMGHL
jgi:hypothetical protein